MWFLQVTFYLVVCFCKVLATDITWEDLFHEKTLFVVTVLNAYRAWVSIEIMFQGTVFKKKKKCYKEEKSVTLNLFKDVEEMSDLRPSVSFSD